MPQNGTIGRTGRPPRAAPAQIRVWWNIVQTSVEARLCDTQGGGSMVGRITRTAVRAAVVAISALVLVYVFIVSPWLDKRAILSAERVHPAGIDRAAVFARGPDYKGLART